MFARRAAFFFLSHNNVTLGWLLGRSVGSTTNTQTQAQSEDVSMYTFYLLIVD